jgi:HK97 family phage portal protein
MSPIPGQSGFPVGYEYRGPNGGRVRYDIDADAGVFPIWHTRFFNPLDDWVGQSPMEAGAYSIDQHNEAMGWMQGLLQNSARPSGALVVQKDSSGAFRDLSPDAFSRLKQQIADQYSGSRNAGRPMLLEGGLDWKAMGLSPSDVGIIEAKNSAARDVALAFGVPPMLLGIPGDNTYANYKEARLAFWEDTVIPLVGRIAGERTQWLADDGMEFRPDFSDVPAIIDKKASQWEAAEASTDLTIDERRAIKGYGPLPNGAGDVLPQQISQPAQHDVTDTNIKAMAKIAGYANAQIDRK